MESRQPPTGARRSRWADVVLHSGLPPGQKAAHPAPTADRPPAPGDQVVNACQLLVRGNPRRMLTNEVGQLVVLRRREHLLAFRRQLLTVADPVGALQGGVRPAVGVE